MCGHRPMTITKAATAILLGAACGLPLVGLAQPSISLQPSDQSVVVDDGATLRVVATGSSPPLTFRWWFQGNPLDQATAPTLLVKPARFADRGDYSVVVTDASGSVTSRIARLRVAPPRVVPLDDRELRFGDPTPIAWEQPESGAAFPHVTPDGLTVLFASDRAGGRGQRDLWIASRASHAAFWGTPVHLSGPVNTAAIEDDPFLSADGLELYFDSNRPGGSGGRDLWIATRPSTAAEFGAPENLGPAINSSSFEGTGCLSRDGRTLLFASSRNGSDLWMSTRPARGQPWTAATNLGAPVNSTEYETTPFLSADGRTLFFMSDRHRPGSGSLWVSRRADLHARFGPPVLIPPISSANPFGADFPMLSADESTLYFNTYPDGFGGRTRLWSVDLTPVPRLQAGAVGPEGTLPLELSGREGLDYTVEVSGDLVSWAPWLTTNTHSRLVLTAPAVPPGAPRFFRAVGR